MALCKNKEKKLLRPLLAEIAQLRKDNQISQKTMADALGINQANYCRIENGERPIKVIELLLIMQTLQVNYQDFFSKFSITTT